MFGGTNLSRLLTACILVQCKTPLPQWYRKVFRRCTISRVNVSRLSYNILRLPVDQHRLDSAAPLTMEDGSPDLSWLCDGVLNLDNITPVDIDISEKHRGPQARVPTILPPVGHTCKPKAEKAAPCQ
jgi:hypothetical protein